MVKQLLSKTLLLVGLLLAGVTSVRAQSDFSSVYTSNVEFPTTDKCKVVINGVEYDGIKAGTASAAGTKTLTFPEGTKYIHLHAAGWNKDNVTISVKYGNTAITTLTLTTNTGIANSSPFTFSGDPSTTDYYKVIKFTAPLTKDTELTFTATSGKRFVLFGVNTEEETSSLAEAEFSFGEETSFTAKINEDFEAPTLSTAEDYDGTVVYSSSNTDIALVDESTGAVTIKNVEGTVTITASAVATENFKAGSASYTITVVDPNKKGTVYNPYTVAEVIDGTATGNGIYVKGFIVGCYNNGAVTSTLTNSNLALADTYNESGSNAIPVQLSNNTDPRTLFNPQDNPWNVNIAQVLVKANAETYFSVHGLKSTTEIKKIAEQVSITPAGMGTYYTDCALDFTGLTDMYAYTAKLDGTTINFTRVQKVPAKTGVLLRNPAGAAASNVVPVAEGETDNVEGNKFVGTLTEQTLDNQNYYILNNGSNGLGFYKVASTGSKVGVHRAYLDASGATGVRSFIGFDGNSESTGIESVAAEAQTFEVYNLQGVRVAQPTKGLYIVNGKKAIFK